MSSQTFQNSSPFEYLFMFQLDKYKQIKYKGRTRGTVKMSQTIILNYPNLTL